MARQLKNQAGGWLPCPWEEFIGRDSSHGASFSSGWDDGNQATFQILVPWLNGLDAELALLGSATFNGISGNLNRTVPARHPYKGSMYAERILSAQPVHWDHKSNGFNAGFNVTTPISEYSYWLLSIGFVTPKYRVMSDAQLLNKFGAMQEWQRFCEVHHKPSITQLSKEGQLWVWNDASLGGINGTQITAPVGQSIYAEELHVKWRRVPRRGLFGNNGESDFYNQNIVNAFNNVHNGATNLWGFSATATIPLLMSNAKTGPLRFVGLDAIPVPSPFDPSAQGLGSLDYNLYYDVDLQFHLWWPPAGNSVNQGHNLAPYSNNFWYIIKTDKGGNPIFQTADLSTIFTLSAT